MPVGTTGQQKNDVCHTTSFKAVYRESHIFTCDRMQPWEWLRKVRTYHIENLPHLPATHENYYTNGTKTATILSFTNR